MQRHAVSFIIALEFQLQKFNTYVPGINRFCFFLQAFTPAGFLTENVFSPTQRKTNLKIMPMIPRFNISGKAVVSPFRLVRVAPMWIVVNKERFKSLHCFHRSIHRDGDSLSDHLHRGFRAKEVQAVGKQSLQINHDVDK